VVKLEFHDADTDTDIPARILADTSNTRDFLKLFLNDKMNETPTFSRRSSRGCRRLHFTVIIPPPLPGAERVKHATLLGVDVSDTLSIAAYINRLLMQVNQRLYLLSLLQSSGLQRPSLHLLSNALVINKLTYALPAYAGQLTVDDKNRVNAISVDVHCTRKSMQQGLTITAFDIDTLIHKSDCKLFRQVTKPGHCLHHRLPPKASTYSSYQLHKRQHPYLLPTVQYLQFKNSYINRCSFKYV